MSRPRTPWAAYDRIRDAASAPDDPLERELYALLTGAPPVDAGLRATVETAYDLHESEARHALNALVMCDAAPDEVNAALELADGVYDAYQTLFFDRDHFRNVFDIRAFVKTLPEDEDVQEVYKLALTEGAGRLLDRYRVKEAPAPAPDKVLGDMMRETHSRAFEHRGRSITSRAAQESFKWGRAAAQNALAAKQATTSDQVGSTLQALKFALRTEDPTKDLTELGVTKDEILSG